MVRELVHEPERLAVKAREAEPGDLPVAQDLLDTLEAHRETCVGMAANMIGVNKNIIVFDNEGTDMVMFNPEIIKSSNLYETEEGCLSLDGVRPTTRYQNVEVEYVTHVQLKAQTHDCKAVIRTGETTPYANIILQAGCIFA